MKAGVLEIEMLASMARLKSDMDKAEHTVGSAMSKIDRAVGGAQKVLGALGLGLSINYFGKLIKGSIDAQDNFGKLAQKINVSVENLAGLDHAASLSGSSLGSIEKALKTVSTQLFDADRGLKASVDTFAQLGINIHETNGELKAADRVMIETADRFSQMKDGAEKTALAVKLFGRSGLELIPMLNGGSAALAEMVAEGKRLNPVTAESAKQAEIYNDNIERLQKSVSALGVGFVNSLLPGLSQASEKMVEFSRSDDFTKSIDAIRISAEALAAILAGRLVLAVGASSAAYVTATVSAVAYEAAVLRMAFQSSAAAGAQYALATASGTAGRALALVGGPIGLLTISLAALAVGYWEVQKAQEAARLGAMSWIARTGGVEGIDGAITHEINKLNELNKTLEQVQKNMADPHAAGEFQRLTHEQSEIVSYINQLAGERIQLQAEVTAGMDQGSESTSTLTRRTLTLAESMHLLNTEAGIGVRKMDLTIPSLLDMGKAMQSLRTGHVVGLDKTFENLNRRIEQYNFRMIGVSDSAPATVKALDEISASLSLQKNMVENLQREWGSMIYDLFSQDNAGDIGDFFDTIAKGYLRMVSEMAAADLASVVFGGKGLGALTSGNLASLFGGGSPGSSPGASAAMSAGSSAAGSLLGGAAGSLAGGALSAAGNGGSLLSSLLGLGGNSMVAPGTAASGLMAGMKSLIMGPAGIAVAALIAGKLIHDKTSDPDGYTRSSAGFLTAPTPGAMPGQMFNVNAFASGFKPIGFADKTSQDEALAEINRIRSIDQTLVDLANAAGAFVDMSRATLAGVGADGRAGTSGTFLGKGGKSTEADLAFMADLYAQQLVKHIEGLTPETMARLTGSSSYAEISEILKSVAKSSDDLGEEIQDLSSSLGEYAKDFLNDVASGGGKTELSRVLSTIDNSNEAMLRLYHDRKSIEEIDSNLGAMGLGNIAATPAGITLELSRQMRQIFEANDRSAADDFARLNPGIASALGYAPGNQMVDGSHSSGLDYVPFDGYRAELHRGERVLTESESEEYDSITGMSRSDEQRALQITIAKSLRKMEKLFVKFDYLGIRERV